MKEQRRYRGKAVIYNIQRFSIHDGPGIRTTVFLKGCPLRCKWCSNPESIKAYPEIWFLNVKCINCHKCVEICPSDAIQVKEDVVEGIDRPRCNLCRKCVEVCPSGAMEQIGGYMTEAEVVEEIEKDSIFYRTSGGGVTFSGGEPAVQSQFIRRVARTCKERGIHVALDTSGAVEWNRLEKILPYVDLMLYDVKHLDPKKHREATGVSNTRVLNNLAKLSSKAKIWLRVPLIPGYNDSPSDMEKLGKFAKEFKIEKISILPYHNAGEPKYLRLGQVYALNKAPLPAHEHVESLKRIMEIQGHKVTIGN